MQSPLNLVVELRDRRLHECKRKQTKKATRLQSSVGDDRLVAVARWAEGAGPPVVEATRGAGGPACAALAASEEVEGASGLHVPNPPLVRTVVAV